jgi:hypothetical protein
MPLIRKSIGRYLNLIPADTASRGGYLGPSFMPLLLPLDGLVRPGSVWVVFDAWSTLGIEPGVA